MTPETLSAKSPTSRRDLVRIGAMVASAGAIVASALMARATSAVAEDYERARHRPVHCFLKGTMVRTADGDSRIEDLAVGDLLPTIFGGISAIQWIGHYRFKRSDPTKPWVKAVLPIRVARSALGPDIPHADLYVTQHHGLLIDGVLVAAGNLVNDTTITRYDASELDELEFFHIKLERHDVIYAEGAPCETLLDVDENAANFAQYLRDYGAPTAEEAPCAPLFRYRGLAGELTACFRNGLSPWIDPRQTVDIIRDKLEARGLALLRQPELIS
jgi:hypothetical protein